MSTQPWVDALRGSTLGEYRVEDHLGGGSFGIVFSASHLRSGAAVAVKVLVPTSDASAAVEFDNEVTLLGKLEPASSVVDILGSGIGEIFLNTAGVRVPLPIKFQVLELARACLEEVVVSRGDFDWRRRLQLWRGAVRGVHQMHGNRVVHRDLKSANCLLFARDQGRVECEVADLGRSRDLGAPAIHSALEYRMGRGDLRFAPPEFLWQQGGDSDAAHQASDLYGLGSLLIELAAGVGITAMVVRSDHDVLAARAASVRRGGTTDLSYLRPNYHGAVDLVVRGLPPAVAKETGALLRQLCDPVPEQRFPRTGHGRRGAPGESLEWLLRRADVMIKQLVVDERAVRKKTKGVP